MKSTKDIRSLPSRALQLKELESVYKSMRTYFGPLHWWPGETSFEVMVGAILTQNTAWTNVEKAIRQLKQADMLTPKKMHRAAKSTLANLIRPAGYFNVKADRLKYFLTYIFKAYDGDLEAMKGIPGNRLRRELLSVKGIGPETADSILLYALGKKFFVIDAYTRRIFERHRLQRPSSRIPYKQMSYEDWRHLFEKSIPSRVTLYNDFHAQIVMTAKNFCKSRQPLCEHCPLQPYL